jgi:aryl-alcohol dehydrogenase-like predicted oxidoreductase
MERRCLGTDGPPVSAIGLGGMSIAGQYGRADERQSGATRGRALERGVTHFNTADFYEGNLDLFRKVLGSQRGNAVLTLKTGVQWGADGRMKIDGSPSYLRQACDSALSRLHLDKVDVYLLARVDPSVAIEESVGAMAELVTAGKVGHIGLSEASPRTVRRAHRIHPIAALETEYSIQERHVEREILPTLRELGIALIAYAPLARGFLTRSRARADRLEEGDFRKAHPRFWPGNFEQNVDRAKPLEQIAQAREITLAQLALTWVLSRGKDVLPIPGAKHPEYIDEDIASEAIKLTAEELAEIERALPPGSAAGDRYPPGFEALVDHS